MMQEYLKATYYIDSDNGEIRGFAGTVVNGAKTDIEKAVKLYYAVRDQIRYNPYSMSMDRKSYRASFVLSQKEGFCVPKAILLAAVSRVVGVPCRLRFANVINHLVTKRLKEVMKTDLFVFHGYNEFFLEGKWVKATPAFNLSLCEKFGVFPLDFDGTSDSIFHPLDREGRKHMEYVHDYGSFDDFPFEMFIDEQRRYYPHLVELAGESDAPVTGDFEQEAMEEN
jgi:transglutaminase-like putative cysteine protease